MNMPMTYSVKCQQSTVVYIQSAVYIDHLRLVFSLALSFHILNCQVPLFKFFQTKQNGTIVVSLVHSTIQLIFSCVIVLWYLFPNIPLSLEQSIFHTQIKSFSENLKITQNVKCLLKMGREKLWGFRTVHPLTGFWIISVIENSSKKEE